MVRDTEIGGSFFCLKCQSRTGVVDSRPALDRTAIRRRRRCNACGFRFSTVEIFVSLEGSHGLLPTSLSSVEEGLAAVIEQTDRLLKLKETIAMIRKLQAGGT